MHECPRCGEDCECVLGEEDIENCMCCEEDGGEEDEAA